MLEERIVYRNGEYIPWNDARVHVMSYSFGRGTAVFEVMSVHEVDGRGAIFRLDEHMDRLFRTVNLLSMKISMKKEDVYEACLELVRINAMNSGFIKVICFHPQIAFEIFPPESPLEVSIFFVDPAADLDRPKMPFEKGATACFSKWRKIDPQCVPVEAKVASNYLNGMMARTEARSRGFDNVIMLDTQGFVAEGGTESVFMVEKEVLLTPCVGTVLLSITRRSLLQVAELLGIEAVETRITPERLLRADEILFSGTPNKVLPVKRVEDRDIEGTPGPITRKLSSIIADITSGRDERFRQWLFKA